MSATTPEEKVKAKIDKILKPYRLRGVLEYNKTAGSMFGTGGWPDYVGSFYAFFLAIEAKHYPNKPSDLQEGRIKAIKRAGGICLVIDERNVDKLEAFLQRLEQRALKLLELLRANP